MLILEIFIDERVQEITSFVSSFCELYAARFGQSSISYNFHVLSHMGEFVKMFGPSMSWSTYAFESKNSLLRKFIRGYRLGLKELANRYKFFLKI